MLSVYGNYCTPPSTLLVKLFTPSPPAGSVPNWIFSSSKAMCFVEAPRRPIGNCEPPSRWRSIAAVFLQNIKAMPWGHPLKHRKNRSQQRNHRNPMCLFATFSHKKKRESPLKSFMIFTQKRAVNLTRWPDKLFHFPSRPTRRRQNPTGVSSSGGFTSHFRNH